MIKAVIFDMDGLLIDSEPLWQEAEKNIFKTVGLLLDDKQVTETTGLRVDEVTEYWYRRSPWDLLLKSKETVTTEIVKEVKKLIREKGKAKIGVNYILNYFYKKNIIISIASSSEYSIINEVVDKLEIRKYLTLIYSAEEEEYGKPHPGVYINTYKKLKLLPDNCIAFEDSFNGVLSAKSAKIKCISIPEKINRKNPKFIIADMILNSLDKFKEKEFNFFNK